MKAPKCLLYNFCSYIFNYYKVKNISIATIITENSITSIVATFQMGHVVFGFFFFLQASVRLIYFLVYHLYFVF